MGPDSPVPDGAISLGSLRPHGFGDINHTYGHAAGDQVLGHVAGRLAGAVHGIDTVACYTGDEFVILPPALESPEEIAVVASRILNSFDPECLVGESKLRVEVAVGQSVTTEMRPMLPDAREELPRQLLMEADADMYRSKPGAWVEAGNHRRGVRLGAFVKALADDLPGNFHETPFQDWTRVVSYREIQGQARDVTQYSKNAILVKLSSNIAVKTSTVTNENGSHLAICEL
ncbi:hypothetical protein GCM10023063_38490 [Arthrobacter methylotrophus]|uniref:GGDEF domain-containing protein n=1 Tax=Arthrobacter methylotrophus TaxID=121291 RepID=A0ABV5UTW9_9MICC